MRSVQYFQELYLRKVKKTRLNYRKHNFLALGVKRLTDHEKFLLGKVILGTWYVVVQFYPCFKFSFLLFQTHYHVITIPEKQKKIKFEPRIKLNHNRYILLGYYLNRISKSNTKILKAVTHHRKLSVICNPSLQELIKDFRPRIYGPF